MQRIIVFILCLMLANITFTESKAKNLDLLDLKKECKIYMKGRLSGDSPAKSAASPLEVYQEDTHIGINFHSNLGYLYVVVVNQYGYPVYQKQVNAANGSNLIISTRSFSSGSYTIYISNTQGYMEGEFAIE